MNHPHTAVLAAALAPLFAFAAPIVLETDTTALRLDVKDGKVESTYFGARLANLDDTAASPLASSLYPTRWDTMTGPHGLAVTQADGRQVFDAVYVSHEVSEPAPGQKLVVIHLKERDYPVTLDLHILAHRASGVFERWAVVKNTGDKPIVVNKAASAFLGFKAGKYFVTSFAGSWGGEATMREQEVVPGVTLAITSNSTPKGAAMASPSFVLALDKPADETAGEVVIGTLAWSGNTKITFDRDYADGQLAISAGYDESGAAYTLAPGKELATPHLILAHSKQGAGAASRALHRWARAEGGIRGGDQPRDILLNSWEGAYFTFDEKLLHGMMDGCKSMGVELFVLDDGWFGNGDFARDGDKSGLGDWQTNVKKLPNGLEGLAKAAHERGVKFGIWVEPEMVNPKSELYTKHPDWVVNIKGKKPREGRNQLILDLTRPEVRDFIFTSMDAMLTQNPNICYVKWDCNFTIVDPGSGHLADDSQQNLQVDYINGYYAVLDRLVKKHPKIVFQACGSGGGRADYGAMKYHHEFWTSDNTDPYDRVFIQWGHSFLFPSIAMAAHVTESPNHYSGRVTPLKFRFDVAMSGRLGLELRPQRLKPEEVEWANQAVAEYKRIRPVIQFGDLYRLQSPYKGDVAALQYVHANGGATRSVVFAYMKEHRLISAYGPIKLAGLDPAKRYTVKEINRDGSRIRTSKEGKSIVAEDGKTVGGDYLMSVGLSVAWDWRALQSVAVEITEAPGK